MSSNNRTLAIDMSSLLSDVSKVVNTHVRKAVMDLSVSNFQEDIEICSEKIELLEMERNTLAKDENIGKTRLQETTYRIKVSLLEQEIISNRKELQSMKDELAKIRLDGPDIQDTCDAPIQNIVLNIQEMPIQESVTENVLDPLEVPDENDQLVRKANEIMSGIHATAFPSLVDPEVVGDDEIYEIMPEDEEEEEEEEEEEGVFEIDVDGTSYYTTGEENGSLYSIDVNGDPDVYVGRLQDGKAVLGSE
jgi:hypothetical protein